MAGDSEAHLSLIIKAKNLAASEIGKTKKSLTDLKSGALDGLGLGMIGVAGAAGLLAGALIKGVQGAVEEEAQLKRMSAALQANVPAWKGDIKAVTDAVHARESLGFSDTALRESMIKLIPATHDVNKALDYQKTAMDLARLKGISLEDASQALVKVEGGQFKMLKSLGIVLKDGATQTEALAAVQKVAMGQAAAYADTLAGKTEVLEARFGDLTENIGGLLIPALTDLADAALKVVDVFDTDSPTTFSDRLEELAGVTNALNPFMWDLSGVQGKLNAQMHTGAIRADDARQGMLLLGDAYRKTQDPTKDLTKDNNALNKSLKVTGAEALEIVNQMIDIRREEEFLMKTNKPFRTSMRGVWGAAGAAPSVGHNAAGGWVGLNGPELSWVGEQGPEYIVPNHQLGGTGMGVTIQGVTPAQIMDIVDKGMYVQLRRAGAG